MKHILWHLSIMSSKSCTIYDVNLSMFIECVLKICHTLEWFLLTVHVFGRRYEQAFFPPIARDVAGHIAITIHSQKQRTACGCPLFMSVTSHSSYKRMIQDDSIHRVLYQGRLFSIHSAKYLCMCMFITSEYRWMKQWSALARIWWTRSASVHMLHCRLIRYFRSTQI